MLYIKLRDLWKKSIRFFELEPIRHELLIPKDVTRLHMASTLKYKYSPDSDPDTSNDDFTPHKFNKGATVLSVLIVTQSGQGERGCGFKD